MKCNGDDSAPAFDRGGLERAPAAPQHETLVVDLRVLLAELLGAIDGDAVTIHGMRVRVPGSRTDDRFWMFVTQRPWRQGRWRAVAHRILLRYYHQGRLRLPGDAGEI